MTVSGCAKELSAHVYSAASLKYHVPDTRHDTTPSHIILTQSLSTKRRDANIFNDFGMSRPGIEPVTSCSPERTLYRLSYRGRCVLYRKRIIFAFITYIVSSHVKWFSSSDLLFSYKLLLAVRSLFAFVSCKFEFAYVYEYCCFQFLTTGFFATCLERRDVFFVY